MVARKVLAPRVARATPGRRQLRDHADDGRIHPGLGILAGAHALVERVAHEGRRGSEEEAEYRREDGVARWVRRHRAGLEMSRIEDGRGDVCAGISRL